jgi:hypothetical protein
MGLAGGILLRRGSRQVSRGNLGEGLVTALYGGTAGLFGKHV